MNDGQSSKKGVPNVRLRAARERRGWSQRELADLLGTSELTVGRWERGERVPQLLFRAKLSELFGTTAQELGFMAQNEVESVSPQTSEQKNEDSTEIKITDITEIQKKPSFTTMNSRTRSFFNNPQYRYVAIALCIILLSGLVLGSVLFVRGYTSADSKAARATPIPITPVATPPASVYHIPAGQKLLLSDTMEDPVHGSWQSTPPDCILENGIYSVTMGNQNYCLNSTTDQNQYFGLLITYTYEIQVALLRGEEAGIIFCKAHKSSYKVLNTPYPPYYYFGITIDGKYTVFRDDGNGDHGLQVFSPYIKKGHNQFNTLAVSTYKNEVDLYINGHLVNKYSENVLCAGGIVGVEATGFPFGGMELTEVAYKNMRLWGP